MEYIIFTFLLSFIGYLGGIVVGVKYGEELKKEWVGWLQGKKKAG